MLDYHYIYRCFIKGDLHPFYVHSYVGLIRYASRLLGEKLAFMAEDCVQDSILNTYINKDKLDSPDRWRSWLVTCIHNRAVEIIRKARNGDNYISEQVLHLDDEDYALAIIEQEALDSIYAAVNSLPEKYRVLFQLSFEQQLKNAEIAQLLDVAEITVKKRKAMLIELLRAKLGNDPALTVVICLVSSRMVA